jgi:Fic family protein
MRKPQSAPDSDKIWGKIKCEPQKIRQYFEKISDLPRDVRYLHWDKLRRFSPPLSMTHEEWWFAIKLQRRASYRKLPLCDKNGSPFVMLLEVDPISERLHEIDLGSGGLIQMPEQITNPETKDQYYISSLIEEAITSSQLEGAATTRLIAKEMIKSGRKPIDRSEQMILNNFNTMQHINKLKNRELSKELVFEIHRLVTENTLDDPTAAGRFRKPDEQVSVVDIYNEVLHEPPSAKELTHRIELMCKFANGQTGSGYIHPVIRSIILHFWLAYDHPFVDGNGRTARAIFYWSMLHHKYWLFEFISISQVLLKAPAKYERAFLYTETDENDLTYFILYHLDVIQQAIRQLHEFIQRKTARLQSLEIEMRGMTALNHRQQALISHALRHPYHKYTIQSHRISHNVVYQTARNDLMDLKGRGLLENKKVGKKLYFTPAPKLEKKLSRNT